MKHLYEKYEDAPLWNIISKAIADLVENQDLVETTRHEYIVGYIVQKLLDNHEKVPALLTEKYLHKRVKKGNEQSFLEVMDKVPDVAPVKGDEL